MVASFSRVLSASRLATPQLRRHVFARGMRTTTSSKYAAQNLAMPAMSPTMTEGTIGSWKVKEGDEFSAGDVLLEIETDKAQMDVEAQEDGVMAQITVQAGAKAIPVGTRIAVLAEPGDDLKTLEIPPESNPSTSSKLSTTSAAAAATDLESSKKDVASPAPSERPKKTETSTKSTPRTSKTKSNFAPSPSVMHLLKEYGLSSSEVDGGIEATGPKGRLLKGDVLAYLGKVKKSYPKELESRIEKLEKLDLSNIKIAIPKKPDLAGKEKELAKEMPKEAELELEISLSEVLKVQNKLKDTLGIHLPLSIFITKATAKANSSLPPSRLPPSADDLFNDLLGLPRTNTHGSYTPQITALPSTSFISRNTTATTPRKELDIIDILSGNDNVEVLSLPPSGKALPPTPGIAANGANLLSVRVRVEEEERARVFLEKVKGLLERDPGSLVL